MCSPTSGSDATGGHRPVLLSPAVELLAVRAGGFYVDGTVGLGGHAAEILRRSSPDGRLLGVDRDAEALARARTALARFGERARLVHGNWRELPSMLGDERPQGVLLDLGVSSLQLDDAERGFSFRADGPLDMRMDRTCGPTAEDVVNGLPERELADLLYRYGEERASRRIARAIVRVRQKGRIRTTGELAEVVRGAASRPRKARRDPATLTFQALRIYVNRELDGLGEGLTAIARTLSSGGRLVVIAFHSLEDREVKQAFRALAGEEFRLLTRKPVRPSDDEVAQNPRARSARLRALAREDAA